VDDYAANTATSGAITVATSVTGVIEDAYERDWFAVTLEASTNYQFDLEGGGGNAGARVLTDPYLRGIHDSSGTRQARTDDDDSGPGNSSRITFAPANTGTYYVSASGDGGAIGAYTLSISTSISSPGGDSDTGEPEDDYGTSSPGSVSVGGTATGVIETTDDEDRFAVTLEAGRMYRIEAKGADSGDGTLGNPQLYLLHYVGQLLFPGASDHDSGIGRNASLTYTPTADGTVYVVVSGDGGTNGTTGSYRVTVSDVSPTGQG